MTATRDEILEAVAAYNDRKEERARVERRTRDAARFAQNALTARLQIKPERKD
jgi:hypothetical protein